MDNFKSRPRRDSAASRRGSVDRVSKNSSVKNALISIPVHPKLIEGVSVVRVFANGKTEPSFLTLSDDKFTLFITASKVDNATSPSGGSSLLKPLGLFRSRSTEEANDDRAVDIGSIDRIQRGQVTHQFELARKRSTDRSTASKSSSSRKDDDNMSSDHFSLNPKRSFSIILSSGRTLDLMTIDANRNDIVEALDRVIFAYQSAKVMVANDVLLLRYVWLDADIDKSNTINAVELGRVLDRINFYMKKSKMSDEYKRFTKILGLDRSSRRAGLTFEQCCTFLHKIKRDTWQVKPINIIWNDLFGEFMNNGKVRTTVSDKTFLEKFLIEKQKDSNATLDQVRDLFARLNQLEIANVADSEPKDPCRIDKNRFEAYLVGRENDAFDRRREKYDKKLMTKPLSEYWISSSHNTYLTGHQFTSHSSVEMYMNSLYRGCRCLELDIWDGDVDPVTKKPVPIVWHGRTMTTKILFVDIIKSIKVFLNFNPLVMPIILSFENHCSIPYQEVMAEKLVKILGDRIYIPSEQSLLGVLPSPKSLRGMVVIKGRRPDGSVDDEEVTQYDSDGEGVEQPYVLQQPAQTTTASTTNHKIAPQLAKLTLFHGKNFKNWDKSLQSPTHYMHSFSESKVRSLCRQNRDQKWTIYNQSHMTRTFPSGSRMDSSNYSPMLAWSVGCQLVALNYQTADSALRLNDGRFRENGGCGYVLKPAALMEKSKKSMKLSVRILSGSCLPKPKGQLKGECISPYVQLSVFDINNEEKDTVTTFNTNVVNYNGFFPIWNFDWVQFVVENAAVAIIQLTVYARDSNVGTADSFVASASIPISCLRQGFRSVQLFDERDTRNGPFDFASLLIEVKMRKHKPAGSSSHPSKAPPEKEKTAPAKRTSIEESTTAEI